VRALVAFVPGRLDDTLRQRIERLPGVSELTVEPFDAGITARLSTEALARIARLPEVLRVEPVRDVMALNMENAPTMQMGSAEDGLLIRPFDLAGVDGGGIDTSGDGRRINDGSDAVPPQIVVVTDNGISLDTPNFSQTATEVEGTSPSIPIGPSHRKVHAIQLVEDDGTGCDAALSGAGTHGNVVAAAVAAYPSELGFFASPLRPGDGGVPRSGNLDGVARGARILLQDVAGTDRCTINSLIERGGDLNPGSLATRLNEAICPSSGGGGPCSGLAGGGGEVHLAVFPFGTPIFGEIFGFPHYTQDAADIDTFLYNNRDFMVVMPVGNDGALVGNTRAGLWDNTFPDFFDGTNLNDDAGNPIPIQISDPATAKNVVAVGASTYDCFTFFGTTDCEGAIARFSSRGPATPQSLRMAPMITAPAFDLFNNPNTAGVAAFRSRDNDNLAPIEAQMDEGNSGTSFAAAYITGAAAVIRDYFAQGFHPTGARIDADQLPNVSGALIKAALAASADFNEDGLSRLNEGPEEALLRRTRALFVDPMDGIIGIMGNSEQGYGRAVLTHVLPLADWSNEFVLHPDSGRPREYPAAGLLVWDHAATGEPLIDNAAASSITHHFRLAAPDITTTGAGGTAVTTGQLRIALAWIDLPSPAGSGGPLTNDLDLVLQGPGADNCLESGDTQPDGSPCPGNAADDNVFYIGNHYGPATNDAVLDQWSIGSVGASPAPLSDERNVVEAIHLSGDPDNDGSYDESPLYVGRWRVTVMRGDAGAIPGQITILGPDEDGNGNHRLDPGEDGNMNGLLDQPGQPYALVVAGPVFLAEAPPAAGPSSYPESVISLDGIRYGCADDLVATILDTTGGASPAQSSASTAFEVFDAAGALTDVESGIPFTTGAPGVTVSAGVPVRLAAPPIVGNGVLEAATGDTIAVTYAPPGQRAAGVRATVNCNPDLINSFFPPAGGASLVRQVTVGGGCDQDDHLDAGEIVTYGVSLLNRSRTDDYADLTATLIPSGPGAGAIRVLDSPQEIGRLPGSGANGVFFHLFVDAAAADALAPADRVVTMTLTLDSQVRGVRLEEQSFTFTHALNSDTEERFYSTDYPAGGREVRDLNRNLAIDPPGVIDPVLQFVLPPEDVTFSSMFVPTAGGLVSNTLGEDLDDSGTFSGGEADIIPNGVLDGGILDQPAGPGAGDRVPWSFDPHGGGFAPFRHPGGTAGTGDIPNHPAPMWEHTTTGICGFQTSAGDGQSGIWHTGDSDPATPGVSDAACDNHLQPGEVASPPLYELVFDVLMSPIIAKVNQESDARGFPYAVEFQRFGVNFNIQTADGYAGGGINIDNDVDDETNSFLGQAVDQYYTRRYGGWPSGTFRLASQYFSGTGINPGSLIPLQRTFGPFRDRGAIGTVDGADSGYTGVSGAMNFISPGTCDTATGLCSAPLEMVGEICTVDTDCDSAQIQQGMPDYLPFPPEDPIGGPATPVPGVCDAGVNAGGPCQVATQVTDCPGSTCTEASNTTAGPVRSFDSSLIGYEGGFSAPLNCTASYCPEYSLYLVPGAAADRWQIALGFWAIESQSGNVDYGVGADDVVFEWKESHPEDEAALGHSPACSRFGTQGEPAGGQCATLLVDRTMLHDCNESLTITLFDAKCVSIGAGNTAPLGGVCATDAECGSGGECTAARPSVEVAIVTDSDGAPFTSGATTVLAPNAKRHALPAVSGQPGLFRGEVTISTATDDPNHVFTAAGSDTFFTVFYEDPLCDGDRDGQAAEATFDNIDGDGVPDEGFPDACSGGATADCNDNCDRTHNPLQGDDDGDGVGDLCDNCPAEARTPSDLTDGTCTAGVCDGSGVSCTTDADCPPYCDTGTGKCDGGTIDGADFCSFDFECSPPVVDQFDNPAQDDGDQDGVGDACDFDDADRDGNNNSVDPCPDVWGTGGLPSGEICSTLTAAGAGITCDTVAGLCDPATGCSQKTGPCDTGTGQCLFGDETNPNYNSCASDLDCSSACAADSDCECDFDRDDDGVLDRDDNCVLTPNGTAQAGIQGVGDQTDSDGDGMGDACDTDCTGAVGVQKCRVAGVDVNGEPMFCAPFGFAYGTSMDGPANCNPGIDTLKKIPVAGWDPIFACVPYTYHPQDGSSVCSGVDDDADADGVEDRIDNCPALANPPTVPGTFAQADADRDGLGDICDPAGDLDDGRDGFPDDVVTFGGAIACREQPLGHFTFLEATYQDLDGDLDPYPDTGETGRVVLTLRNDGPALSDATIVLSTDDPEVACLPQPAVVVGSVAAGAVFSVGSLDPLQPGFTFTASDTLQSGPLLPGIAKIDFCLDLLANEVSGLASPVCFFLIADVDIPPGGAQTFTLGPDGLSGTGDDGLTSENFDLDRDGDGDYTVRDTFLQAIAPGVYRGACSNAPLTECQTIADCPPGGPDDVCYSGGYMRGSADGSAPDAMAGVACGGYVAPPGNPACILDPDYPMDWHLHCPNGASSCPNLESGACVGSCSFDTPSDVYAEHAVSLPNSLHMGAHFSQFNSQFGDTTHLRALQSYRSAPLNLALIPRPGDLELSFKTIVRLMDNNGVSVARGQCADCAQVQIQIDENPDPAVDAWGFWDTLVPFQNVYDKKPNVWSYLSAYYCIFTPSDTGTAPPNPRGVHETLCYPAGPENPTHGLANTWARCGSTTSTSTSVTGNCAGPGILDANGRGIWVETKFDLLEYFGQRVRLRWIGESWLFDANTGSYFEVGPAWSSTTADDGWWIDDIVVTGTLAEQLTAQPDTRPSVGSCPSLACDDAQGDGGTNVLLEATNGEGVPLDGITNVPTAGEIVRISAAGSTFPGGCSGAGEYRFLKNGVVVQEYSAATSYLDAPEASASYTVLARCSADFACTSVVGATIDVAVYSGEGGDSFFGSRASPPDPSQGVLYDPATGETTLNWWSPGNDAVDLYRGSIASGSGRGTLVAPFYELDTTPDPAACLLTNVPGTPASIGSNGTSGSMDQTADPDPPVGEATYYLLSRNAPGGGSVNGLGCAAPGVCADAPATLCSADVDCGTGACLTHTGVALPGGPLTGPLGCPPPGDAARVVRRVDTANLCP
jgi:hypothetical protein